MKRLFILFLLTSITSLAFAQCPFEKHIKFYPAGNSKIIQTSDGCYVTVLCAAYDTSSGQDIDICIVKTDTCGNIIWQAHTGIPGVDDGAIDVVQDDSGNYIVTGFVSLYTSFNNIMNVKYSKDGKLVWSKIYSNNTYSTNIIKRKNKNRFIITGSYEYGSPTVSVGYVLEIDNNGTTTKSSTLPFNNILILKTFQTNDSSYLMILLSSDSLFIAQTDTAFNVQWKKNLFPATYNLTYKKYYDACLSFDGNSLALLTDVRDSLSFISLYTAMIRYSLNGDKILHAEFQRIYGYPTVIIPTSNNGYIVGKSMYYTDSNFNKIKYYQTDESFYSFIENADKSITASGESQGYLYIVRTDALGNIFHAGINDASTSLSTIINLFPNPSSGKIHIQTKNNETINTVKLYDFTGKEINISIPETHSSEITIDATNLKPGIYFLLINEIAYKVLIE